VEELKDMDVDRKSVKWDGDNTEEKLVDVDLASCDMNQTGCDRTIVISVMCAEQSGQSWFIVEGRGYNFLSLLVLVNLRICLKIRISSLAGIIMIILYCRNGRGKKKSLCRLWWVSLCEQ
jgi:hypothetical protein